MPSFVKLVPQNGFSADEDAHLISQQSYHRPCVLRWGGIPRSLDYFGEAVFRRRDSLHAKNKSVALERLVEETQLRHKLIRRGEYRDGDVDDGRIVDSAPDLSRAASNGR